MTHGYKHTGKLARGGGFAGAVNADNHNDGWLTLIRHGLNGTVHLWVACLDEAFTQHGTGLVLAGDAALSNLLAQGVSHFHSGLGA